MEKVDTCAIDDLPMLLTTLLMGQSLLSVVKTTVHKTSDLSCHRLHSHKSCVSAPKKKVQGTTAAKSFYLFVCMARKGLFVMEHVYLSFWPV